MKVLHLTLKKKWFDMIASGEKKEEYREWKPYWYARFVDRYETNKLRGQITEHIFESFDVVEFRNGYNSDSPKIKARCLGIRKDEGKPEWGAEPGVKYFVIELGDILR